MARPVAATALTTAAAKLSWSTGSSASTARFTTSFQAIVCTSEHESVTTEHAAELQLLGVVPNPALPPPFPLRR